MVGRKYIQQLGSLVMKKMEVEEFEEGNQDEKIVVIDDKLFRKNRTISNSRLSHAMDLIAVCAGQYFDFLKLISKLLTIIYIYRDRF